MIKFDCTDTQKIIIKSGIVGGLSFLTGLTALINLFEFLRAFINSFTTTVPTSSIMIPVILLIMTSCGCFAFSNMFYMFYKTDGRKMK